MLRTIVRIALGAHEPLPCRLKAALASVRGEQKRLAKAVALSDDVPELVVELQQRSARIQNLGAQLIAARLTPTELAALGAPYHRYHLHRGIRRHHRRPC